MLHHTDKNYYKRFILKPLLLVKNRSFSANAYDFFFDFCFISFHLRKGHKLLLDAFRAGNFLFCLTHKKPRISIKKQTGNMVLWTKLSFRHAFLVLSILTDYFVTNDRVNSVKGPFLNGTGTVVNLEMHDLMFFNTFLSLDADYYDFTIPLFFSLCKKSGTLLETWNLLCVYDFTANCSFKQLLETVIVDI